MTWLDPARAEDYVVFEQVDPRQVFDSIVATSSSGLTGAEVSLAGGERYYLVVGRNDECGLGH